MNDIELNRIREKYKSFGQMPRGNAGMYRFPKFDEWINVPFCDALTLARIYAVIVDSFEGDNAKFRTFDWANELIVNDMVSPERILVMLEAYSNH
jgi:hypothetical protein